MEKIAFLFLISTSNCGQHTPKMEDTYLIYNAVLKFYHEESKMSSVYFEFSDSTDNGEYNITIDAEDISGYFKNPGEITVVFREVNAKKEKLVKSKLKNSKKSKEATPISVQFSKIYLSDDKKVAIVYSGITYSALNGEGRIFLMEKENKGWVIKKKIRRWIS